MLWLIYCALFLLLLFNVFRMLMQRGKWAWILFLGLIASAGAYVALVVTLASSASLQSHRVWQVLILIGGTLFYLSGLFYFVRMMAAKLKGKDVKP